MRTLLLAKAALVALLILPAAPRLARAQADMVSGQVTNIDPSTQKITIRHGPIQKFGMDEGHTMVFRAQDPAMLRQVKVGDRIRFVPDRINGQLTVTAIEKAR
jgi:Cu(I)/Ag(I) efflux system protein CusF